MSRHRRTAGSICIVVVIAFVLVWMGREDMPPPAPRQPTPAPQTSDVDARADAVPRVAASPSPQAEPVADAGPRGPARTSFEDERHDIIEVGDILRLPIDSMLERLPLTDAVRSACAAKELRRSVELQIAAARQRLDELFEIHATLALQAAETLFAEGRGRRTEPAAHEADSYSMVMVGDGKVWMSREDLPELFAIKDGMRRLVTDLADELTRLASGPTAPDPGRR